MNYSQIVTFQSILLEYGKPINLSFFLNIDFLTKDTESIATISFTHSK